MTESTPLAFLCTARARTAHEYPLLSPDLRPRATCGKRSTAWIQDLLPAANINMASDRPYNMVSPVYCPECLAGGHR
jgi:hypothetical protein